MLCVLIAANHQTAVSFFNVYAAPTASPTPQQQGCCGAIQPTRRRMIGTYYNTENKMTSTLTLNNKGPHPIAVTPILYNLDGGRFIGSPITVGGEASENVELGLLAAIAGPQFRAGSFEFSYEGRVLEMGGGLRIVNETKSLIFDEQMLEPGMKFSSPRMEAVYSIPFESVEASVILSNKTDKVVAINGDAVFAGSNGHHPINGALKPYQTSIVKLPPGLIKKAAAGAVTLSHNGGVGALMAIIHLQEPDKGFSAAVNFTDPGKGKTNQYHGAGLRLGSVNGDQLRPIIAIRNLGSQETSVTGRIPFTNTDGSQGKVELRKTALAAGEIKLLSVPGIAGANLATAGLELEYDGAPGSVIADALSVSDSGNQVFTLPLKDPQGGMSSTGGYPWFITDTSSTVVFIKNTTAEPQQFHLDIVYAAGRWGSNLKTLVPGQTIAFDLRKIRDAGEIGSEGNTIPANASSGHIAWKLRGARDKVLIGRAQTVDAAKGMASTYECQCTCGGGFYASRMTPGSVTGFPGDTTQFFAQEQDANCFGFPMSWYDILSSQATFSSDNTNVAIVTTTGQGIAIAPGATYLRASFDTAGIWYANPFEGGCVLQPVTTECLATCTVDPRIRVIEVGFKNDHSLRTWNTTPSNQHQIDDPDGSEPTWKRTGNPNYPVAYTVSSSPAIFAKLTATPIPSTQTLFQARIKIDSNVVATVTGLDAMSGTITLPSVSISQTLPNVIKINKFDYKWEVSFDSGNTWKSIGESGEHKIYTIAGNPQFPTFASFNTSATYSPLYTLALEKACKYIDGATGTIDTTAASELAKGTSGDTSITYNPGLSLEGEHPLKAYSQQCLCADYAHLLRGLLRSIGGNGTVTFMFAGNDNQERAYYRWPGSSFPCSSSDTRGCVSFRVSRPAKGGAPINPHFTYHAGVSYDGKLYDAVYGDSYTQPMFSETAFNNGAAVQTNTAFPGIWLTGWSCLHNE